jgi:hypothetical protein
MKVSTPKELRKKENLRRIEKMINGLQDKDRTKNQDRLLLRLKELKEIISKTLRKHFK